MYKIELYTTPSGNCPIEKYLKKLKNEKEISQIKLKVSLLAEYGMRVNEISKGTIKQIDGDLWELRPDAHRVFFFQANENAFILLHAFRKQTNKTPRKEKEKAFSEMKDHKGRLGNG